MVDFYKVKCTRVIDGDTFVGTITFGVFNMSLEDQKFRLMDVDTPERKDKGFYEATEYTAQLIEDKNVFIYLHGRDSFGRWLVDVYLDGSLDIKLNDLLLSEGLAKKYEE